MNLELGKKQELATKLKSEVLHSELISKMGEEIWGLSTPAGLLRAERRANLLINLSGMNKSQSILEIGCGSGIFTQKICSVVGAAITAIDISEAMLELAKKRYQIVFSSRQMPITLISPIQVLTLYTGVQCYITLTSKLHLKNFTEYSGQEAE